MEIQALFEKLASPAQRAIQALKLKTIEELSDYSKGQISELHGIGPNALKLIEAEMKRLKIKFKTERTEANAWAESAQTGYTSINEYIHACPKSVQQVLQEVRKVIKKAVPDAQETISYQMPAFALKGILVWFAAHKKHIGLYPMASGIAAFKHELSAYKGAKGSVQFPLAKPMPLDLIARIAKYRAKENERKFQAKRKAGKK